MREPQSHRQASRFRVAEDGDREVPSATRQIDAKQTEDWDMENVTSNGDANNDNMDVDAEEPLKSARPQTKDVTSKGQKEGTSDETRKIGSPKSQNLHSVFSLREASVAAQDEAYASQSTLRDTQVDSVFVNYQSSTQQSHDSAYASQDTQNASFIQSKTLQQPISFQSGLAHIPTKQALSETRHIAADQPMEDVKSGSEGSSPVRPIIRKSSLNFASLPAREPLTTKKSFGARTSRTSNLDASKVNGSLRTSYHGHQQTGKSIGHADYEDDEDQEDSDVDMDLDPRPGLSREESDGESRMTKLHNKTSTQRLHDKINALGQSHAPRPTKSIPSAACNASQLAYPDVPQAEGETSNPIRAPQSSKPRIMPSSADGIDDEDEDDWIPSKAPVTVPSGRPNLLKSYSTEVMEQIRGKDSIGGLEGFPASPERLTKTVPTSLGSPALNVSPKHGKSASVSDLPTQVRPGTASSVSHGKMVSVSNPDLASRHNNPHQASYTPAGTPVSKRQGDGPISASKAKLSSILKSARGIFASSAGVSAQAKMETLSPRSIRLREQMENPSINSLLASHAANQPTKTGLYPNIANALEDTSRVTSAATTSPKRDEGRRTRSSSEREEKMKEKEREERERQRIVGDLEKAKTNLDKARDKEAQKALAHRMERERVASQEKQYLLKKEQEKVAKANQTEQPTRKSPRKMKTKEDHEAASSVRRVEDADPAMADAQAAEDHQAKSREPRRPMKPIKEMAAKSKPAPVSIRVGTASQWELDHRKVCLVFGARVVFANSQLDWPDTSFQFHVGCYITGYTRSWCIEANPE